MSLMLGDEWGLTIKLGLWNRAMADQKQGARFTKCLTTTYDCFTIMPKLRSTDDGRLIYKISYKGRKAFLG